MSNRRAYYAYLFSATASGLLFATVFTTSAVYRVEIALLNPLQLILVGTALELSVFLFEIPTGVVADLYSRRLSVIIGTALIGLGLMLEGATPIFWVILLAQVVWGIGYTFTSGAQDAWLADEIGEANLSQAYLRGSQLGQVARFAGIFVGVSLASIGLHIPYFVGGAGLVLSAIVLLLFMPETGFTPTAREKRDTFAGMRRTFSDGMAAIRVRPLMVTILGISLIAGLSSEGIDRLWQAHLLENFTLPAIGGLDPVYWFGLISALSMAITLITTEYFRRRTDELNHRRLVQIQMGLTGIVVAGLALFGLATGVGIAIVAYIIVSSARNTVSPLFWSWANRGIESRVRATVLSTIGQMDAIGQVVGGPPVGFLALRFGLRVTMVVIAALLSVVLTFYKRALMQEPLAGE